jgi:hypothetical protein
VEKIPRIFGQPAIEFSKSLETEDVGTLGERGQSPLANPQKVSKIFKPSSF